MAFIVNTYIYNSIYERFINITTLNDVQVIGEVKMNNVEEENTMTMCAANGKLSKEFMSNDNETWFSTNAAIVKEEVIWIFVVAKFGGWLTPKHHELNFITLTSY